MTDSNQTSVFIQGSNQPRESVSGRPLLTSTNSNNKQDTHRTSRRRFMTSQRGRTILLVALVILIITIIVILATTLSLIDSKSSSDAPIEQKVMCKEVKRNALIDTSSPSHPRCREQIRAMHGCDSPTQNEWRLLNMNSTGWNSASFLVPVRAETSTIIVSPLYTNISSNSCSLQISFNFQSNSSFQVFIVSSNLTHSVIVTSDNCHYGFIDDRSILSRISEFRVLIVSDSLIIGPEASGSVTSHSCYKYENIDHSPIVTSNPQFSTVRLGSRNLCSSEIFNRGDVECDWWNVVGLGNANFTRQETHPCIARGVSYRENDGFSWFLSLNATYNETRALLISPIIEGGTSHLLLSLWYLAQCSGSVIRVFIVPSSRDVGGVVADALLPSFEIRELDYSYKWKFNSTVIEVPKMYSTFHVVIKGEVSKHGSCEHHKCSNKLGEETVSAKLPLLAIDDISVEMRYGECQPSGNNTVVIDCAFQSVSNSSTTCSWKSSVPSNVPEFLYNFPGFGHWKLDNEGDDEILDHGANPEHLEGRGYIMSFDASGASGTEAHLRSPVLVGNSNCSCGMSFLYLLRGRFAPRLQINLVLGADVTSNNRRLVPQWSRFGHQSEDWRLSRLFLNIQTLTPFQVEIMVRDVSDGTGDAHVDDIFFHDCDISLYESR